ncbi:hydroxysqualene dehydroxylase [Marinobacter salicampi]|uniref:hydroxysqualene dehydroxylase n=1 Tax=Marinobacter salicampi TaxID=435907 RepID=UPI00140B8258|nr:FAD-dependent oxidoreductase [Marinobacter salicampi]
MQQNMDVLIIGGGVAGLTAAIGLIDQGFKVTLIEGSDSLGGRAQSMTDRTTGERVDLGPHVMVTQYRNMLKLLENLGTEKQVVWQRRPHLILVDKPEPVVMRLRSLPAPLHFAPSMLNVPQVSWADLFSNRRVLWQLMRLDEEGILELDEINAEQHLREMGVSERALDWFWRSAAMTIMNAPLELCSAGALLRFIRYLGGRNDYQVGFAGEGLGDLFAPEAARRIRASGGQVLLDTSVAALVTEDGRELRARFCIVATPLESLLSLVPDDWPLRYETFANLDRFKPSPYICTYLWFAGKLTKEPFWTKVWSPDNLNYDFYDLSNIKPSLAGKSSVIACNCMYSLKSDLLTDEEIVSRTQAEVAEYLPAAAQMEIQHARVHRVPMGIPVPAPGTEKARPDTTTPIPGLYLAGDWINTGLPSSMESAARSGWMAAEQVLAKIGRPCALAQPLPKLTGLAWALGRKGGKQG